MIRQKKHGVLLSISIVAAILFFSCSKDLSVENGTDLTPGTVTIIPTSPGALTISLPVTPVTLSIAGQIIDQNDNAVAGAAVTGGGKSTITDSRGIFRINNGNFNGSFATVTVSKANFFTLVKTVTAQSNATKYIKAKLSPLTLAGTIPVTGGSVTYGSGALTMSFSANSFVDLSGNAVNSDVKVYLTYIDPSGADAYLRMPGNLSAVTAPSAPSLLVSYGMLAAELRNSAGQKVNLAPGKYASITVQIPSSGITTAPATIPLWYFDETGGVWVKQGEATKTGNTYKGDLAHFTFWNLDVSSSYQYFSARFKKRSDSTDLPYAHLSFQVNNSYGIFHEFTDATGSTFGLIPSGAQLRMKFYHDNGTVLLDTLIGPYMSVASIGTVYINYPVLTRPVITGTLLTCNSLPVTHGSLTAVCDSLDYHAAIDASGHFTIPISVNVPVPTVIHITGFDSTTNTAITPVDYTYTGNNNIVLGSVYACGAIPGEYINYTLDGVSHSFQRNLDSAFCNPTFVFNRTNIACRRANGSPNIEGYVAFITGPTTTGGTDTSSVLTVESYTSASTPSSLRIISFNETYTRYPVNLATNGWITGNFTVLFRDTGTTVHSFSSQFNMYRQ